MVLLHGHVVVGRLLCEVTELSSSDTHALTTVRVTSLAAASVSAFCPCCCCSVKFSSQCQLATHTAAVGGSHKSSVKCDKKSEIYCDRLRASPDFALSRVCRILEMRQTAKKASLEKPSLSFRFFHIKNVAGQGQENLVTKFDNFFSSGKFSAYQHALSD